MKNINKSHLHSEKGSGGVKLLFGIVILGLFGNAFYHYIPTVYQGQTFKQDMEAAVTQGTILPPSSGKPVELVRTKVNRAMQIHNLPHDAFLDVKKNKKVITARVYYVKQIPIIPFGVYDYEYVFDHSSVPAGFSDR